MRRFSADTARSRRSQERRKTWPMSPHTSPAYEPWRVTVDYPHAESAFDFHVLDKGIGHAYINPRTPRLNGKAARSHRIDNEEF